MKKKALCLLLAMIMVLSILAGCTSKPAETPDTPATSEPAADNTANTPEEQPAEQPEEPAEQPEEPALEQKTIQLMITGAGKQANSDKVWAAFNEQLQQYVPNTTVEFIDVSFDEYSEKFSQILASGEGVDLAWTGWLINKPQNIADGNLMPLDDLLAEYGQGIVDILGENVVEIHRNADDGKLYYLPSWQGLVGDRRGWLVVTEIAELAGDTWIEDTEAALNKWRNNYSEDTEAFQAVLDQATKYLAAAKEAGKLGAGINTGRVFGWSMYNGTRSNPGVGGAEIGIPFEDNTFTVIDGVASEHYKLYAKTMADWYKEGYIRSDIMSVDTSTLTMPKNGEITDTTYVFSCDPYLTEADQDAVTADAGMDMTYLPVEENASLILGGDTSYAIPYCADEPERAMMVLNAIYSQPDLYNTLIYGIEGEDYTKNADGTTTYNVTTTLTNTITPEEAASAPLYIYGGNADKRDNSDMLHFVYFIAPAGGAITNFSASDGLIFIDYGINQATLSGLQFIRVRTHLRSGESGTFTYQVTVPAEATQPLALRTTPLAQESLMTNSAPASATE